MSSTIKEKFTPDEKKQLDGHFSNDDKDIFAITTPSQVDRGAMMARYSRTDKSMRRIFLDEFVKNPNRGEDFYDTVLSQYGDDSVAELGDTQIAIENLSQVAVKTVEDRRIGLSYLEKSSRYVPLNKKVNGNFKYYRDPTLMGSRFADQFTEVCDLGFQTYNDMMPPMEKLIREELPITHPDLVFTDSVSGKNVAFGNLKEESDIKAAESVYNRSVKSKVLDTVRGVLPAATLTNVGVTGNGRAFEYLISVLYSNGMKETSNIADGIRNELGTTMNSFVKRVDTGYGKGLQSYMKEVEGAAKTHAQRTFPEVNRSTAPTSELVHYEDNDAAERKVVTSILFPQSDMPYQDVKRTVDIMTPDLRKRIISDYVKPRQNRRQRPGRAFEATDYTVAMCNNFGIFRDIHRHRILTLDRGLLSTNHGYSMPEEIEKIGMEKDFKEVMKKSDEAYKSISEEHPKEAQYVVTFANNYPYSIKFNLREAAHMLEIRTISGGHPDYRKVAQDIYTSIKKVHPNLAEGLKFVDFNDYYLGRYKSEKRTHDKLSKGA